MIVAPESTVKFSAGPGLAALTPVKSGVPTPKNASATAIAPRPIRPNIVCSRIAQPSVAAPSGGGQYGRLRPAALPN